MTRVIFLLLISIGVNAKVNIEGKEFKKCYVYQLRLHLESWKERTEEHIKFTRTKKYYKRSKRSYEMWFENAKKEIQVEETRVSNLEKKYGKVKDTKKECDKFNGEYELGSDYEKAL